MMARDSRTNERTHWLVSRLCFPYPWLLGGLRQACRAFCLVASIPSLVGMRMEGKWPGMWQM